MFSLDNNFCFSKGQVAILNSVWWFSEYSRIFCMLLISETIFSLLYSYDRDRRESKSNRERSHTYLLTPKMPIIAWAGPGQRVRNSVQIFQMNGKDPTTWAIPWCLPGFTLKRNLELEMKLSFETRGFNMGCRYTKWCLNETNTYLVHLIIYSVCQSSPRILQVLCSHTCLMQIISTILAFH